MIEVETPQEIEVVSNGTDVETRSLDVEVVYLKELDVTVAKREFVITGDDIYVPKLYDDAPQWMKDLVQLVVNSAVDTGNASTLAQLASMLSQFATSYVPLNQYTQSILDLSNADASIHAVIETLNSNYNDGLNQANAQILDIQNTKASKDEVVTQVVNTLAAQLANPTSSLGAAIGNLQQTVANNQNANALSMQTLTASLNDVSGNVSSNATVINNALAYVGIDEAGASTNTGLSAYLEGNDGNFGSAGSQINNDIKVTAEGVESKWAYNSTVNINGVYKKSGFGLTTNYTRGSGTEVDPYVSEFWIDASRLKFTNAAKTGSKAPFTIDASGSTPQVTFNGIVSFSNVTGYTPPDVSGSISSNNDVFAQKLGYANYAAMVSAAASGQTVINGGYINTWLIQAEAITASKINTAGLIAENISANEIVGKTLTGAVINGAVINGAVVKASYLDLDGQLEVLTNYHITPAMYSANPSLYTDAVYMSGTNEWRIPSISTIRESTVSYTAGGVSTYYGTMYSYNTANVGSNNKAVRINPYFTVATPFTLFSSKASSTWFGYNFSYGVHNHYRLSLGSTILFDCVLTLDAGGNSGNGGDDTVILTISGSTFTTFTISTPAFGAGTTNTTNLNIGIGSITLNTTIPPGLDSESNFVPHSVEMAATLQAGTQILPFNWTSGSLKFEQLTVPSPMYNGSTIEKTVFALNQSLYINNMI